VGMSLPISRRRSTDRSRGERVRKAAWLGDKESGECLVIAGAEPSEKKEEIGIPV